MSFSVTQISWSTPKKNWNLKRKVVEKEGCVSSRVLVGPLAKCYVHMPALGQGVIQLRKPSPQLPDSMKREVGRCPRLLCDSFMGWLSMHVHAPQCSPVSGLGQQELDANPLHRCVRVHILSLKEVILEINGIFGASWSTISWMWCSSVLWSGGPTVSWGASRIVPLYSALEQSHLEHCSFGCQGVRKI